MKLVLFDLDGTLMVTRGVGKQAFLDAGQEVFGSQFSLEGVALGGGLDPQLIRECCTAAKITPQEDELRTFRSIYHARLSTLLNHEGNQPKPRHRALPNVEEVLNQVARLDDVVLGLLTGNFEEAAEIKLASVGLDYVQFKIKVFGDEAATRSEMVALAMIKLKNTFDSEISPKAVLIIGDTPRDIACAHAQGAKCLAVATGQFSREELLESGADWAMDSLATPAPLFQWLESVP